MRFQTIVACVVVALASSSSMVAAQTDPGVSMACVTCIGNVVQSYSVCNGPNYNPSNTDNPQGLNAAELKCFCTLISDNWSSKCNNECGADYMRLMSSAYGDMKKTYCSGVSTAGSSASTVKASTGVAMALGAAFAQALL